MKEYLHFLGKSQKVYASQSDSVINRYEVFRENYKNMEAHNSQEDASFLMGINEFSDLTDAEVEQTLIASSGLRVPAEKTARLWQKSQNNKRFLEESYSDSWDEERRLKQEVLKLSLPESVNWYAEGKVSRPYSQANCGACWAFSAAAALESLRAINVEGA